MLSKRINLYLSKFFSVRIFRDREIVKLLRYKNELDLLTLVNNIFTADFAEHNKFFEILSNSKSDHFQDLLVANICKYKKGYYVEIGAADGIKGSNTFVLEKNLAWSGILIEPARIFHDDLKKNRPLSQICHALAWNINGQTKVFNETTIPSLSCIDIFSGTDKNSRHRISNQKYSLRTQTLNSVFEYHNVPSEIDYISIDCEGSELHILEGLNFDKYHIKIFSIEHNYNKNRDQIIKFMKGKGYEIKYSRLTNIDYLFVKIT